MSDKNSEPGYWVVSPNVKPHEKNVEEWKEASRKHRAAFMG